ncbi:uncharacterized protein LOC126175829 [Schistocerca cancellata]|uniref:uncharacterized protein LOC126175829 n=1 Tax=Schistocerca cancellata TaxID=274614 RepID=UPI002119022E|nr:uncharacterized protein LOC126175829 [Schistocerca cancellata]XP_049778796.1 uncharacterized protein LOC126175829 [Schistocerca cancellata]
MTHSTPSMYRPTNPVIHSINELSAGDAVGFSVLQHQAERLLSVISHEAIQQCVDDTEHLQTSGLSDRILRLESRARPVQGVDSSVNTRGSRCDIDERYPDMSSSRESLMDLGNVVSLPPVPEDSLGNFCKLAVRTSSLSSLKNFRKVKLCLQRASSEEDEDSESEEHSFASSDEQGSSDKEMRPAFLSQKKNIMLGNIKEEV